MQPGLGELLAEMNEEIAARRRFLDRATSGSEPPYADMDASIVALVRAINQLPGLYTSGSCGGHEEPLTPVSAPADEWWIGIELASVKRDKDLVEIPTDEAWLSLEFLTYVTGHLRKNGVNVQLRASANPPWLNTPGRTLGFVLEGTRDDESPYEPDDFADRLTRDAIRYYVPADFAWTDDDGEC